MSDHYRHKAVEPLAVELPLLGRFACPLGDLWFFFFFFGTESDMARTEKTWCLPVTLEVL